MHQSIVFSICSALYDVDIEKVLSSRSLSHSLMSFLSLTLSLGHTVTIVATIAHDLP